jgi:hypothetical protein
VRLSARTVEVFRAGRRVAAHPRGASGAPASTLSDHMPAVLWCTEAEEQSTALIP